MKIVNEKMTEKLASSHNKKPNILWLFNDGPGQQYFRHVSSAIRNAGGNPVIFDYINVFDVKEHDVKVAKNNIISHVSDDDVAMAIISPNSRTRKKIIQHVRKLSNEKLKKVVENFIEERNITGIFLPGDYYNYDTAPYHPEPQERPRYSKIFLDIAKERNIPLIGVCGGLQTIANYENIAIKRVEDMVSTEDAQNHILTKSASALQETIRRELVMPDTKLERFFTKINSKFGIKNTHEKYLYVPEAHLAAIDNSWENRLFIENKGYKINAVSSDGIIQGIEHKKHPIMGFQGHPEVMAARKEPFSLNLLKHFLIDPAKERMLGKEAVSSESSMSR